ADREAVDPRVVLVGGRGQQAQGLHQLRRRLVQRAELLLGEHVVDDAGDAGPIVLGDVHVTQAKGRVRPAGVERVPQPVHADQRQLDDVVDDAHLSPITGGTDFSSVPNNLFGSSVAMYLRLCCLSSPLLPAAPAPPIMPIGMPPRMPPMPAARPAAAAAAPPAAPEPTPTAPLARPSPVGAPDAAPLPPKAPGDRLPAPPPTPEPAKSDGEKLEADVPPNLPGLNSPGLNSPGENELVLSASRARRACSSAASRWRRAS